jgi:predicted deacetylase
VSKVDQKIKYYLILFLILFSSNTSLLAQDSLIFVIRVDDILNRNTSILPRSIKAFEKVVNQRNAKVTWGVIPHRLIESIKGTDSLIHELIRTEQKGHEVSLHGYNHICPHCGGYHEFYCPQKPLSYQEQDSLINKGLKILDRELGITPSSFIPPAHAADSTTYQVLLDNSINIISVTEPVKTYLYQDLYNMGINKEYTWGLDHASYQSQLENALTDIHKAAKEDHYFGILFHDHFTRIGYQDSLVLRWTGELLDSLVMEYGDRIQFKTVSQAAAYFGKNIVSIETKKHTGTDQFSLDQNYPNPFNRRTKITYTITGQNHVKLIIYDIKGQPVKTLINENQVPGQRTIFWNGKNDRGRLVSTGIYFYRLHLNKLTKTKKLLFIK